LYHLYSLPEALANELHRAGQQKDVEALQKTYNQLRAAFAHLLFDLLNAPTDHYSWLLLNQDASRSLDRLLIAREEWADSQPDDALWRIYQRELSDFEWIVSTAMTCSP
jgi:hypothetical protein